MAMEPAFSCLPGMGRNIHYTREDASTGFLGYQRRITTTRSLDPSEIVGR